MAGAVSIVLSPIVDNIIGTVASLIKKEFLAIKGVKKDVEKLSSNLKSIKAVLKDAEQRQLDAACNESLRDWLAKLKDVALDVEDILDTFAIETLLWERRQKVRKIQPPISLSKASYKFSVAREIKQISEKINLIDEEKNKFHLNVSSDTERSQGQNLPFTTSFVDTTVVFGRDSDKERLIDQMLSNESDTDGDVSVIPIIGMGGLGKTTLAQLIFNDERVKKHFEFRMWVCVTVDFNLRRILKEMIEFHTEMEYSNDLATSFLESRFLEFLAGKNFLLVLDDVWTDNYLEWEQLRNILKQGGKGSRVLVTTRTTRVSDTMGTQTPYRLEYLPEEECWSLFEKIAFKGCNLLGGTQKELEGVGRQIVRKCNGLPLAVKAMGGLLRGNYRVDKWKQILRHSIWELEEEENPNRPKILPVLKLSYDHLPSYLKQCFAYCSVFPNAYVFDRKELVKLWMAEGFIQSSGQNSMEDTGVGYFEELLMRSFFQNLNVDSKVRYRMHDLIHDLAVSVSSPQCCPVKDNNSCNFSEKSRHVSLICQDLESPIEQITKNCNKLRTLLLPSEDLKSLGQALDKMFRSLKYVRVLDLSSSSLSELPESVEELKLLRYVDLSKTEIKILPNSICNLRNLQTLKLLGCIWLFELPKDLGEMVNLIYLELDEMFWFKCRMLPPNMGKLTSLQNLHAFRVSGTNGHGIGELKDMAKLTGTLHISNLENAVNAAEAKLNEKKSLQKLVLEWSDKDFNQEDEVRAERDLEDLQPHSNLKELVLNHFKGFNFPSWMTDGLLQNLVALTLRQCSKFTTISIGQLPSLQVLHIKGLQELEEWQEVRCPSLHRLHISNCPKLRKVPDLMPYLKVLKIKKCDSLKALPMAPLMFLVLIDNLALEDWKEGMRIAKDDQGNQIGQPRPTLNGLLELKMVNCPKIQALPQVFALQKLEISGCQLINNFPVLVSALNLQHLALETFSNETLVTNIPSANFLYSLVISNIANLTSFPELPRLPGLKSLYISDCNDLTSLSEEEGSLKTLSSLKLLSIRGCPKIESLPDEGLPPALECLVIASCPILKSLGSKQTLKSLLSLKDLYLEDCPLIQSFPKDELPSSLQHLEIHGCPLLTKQCQNKGAEWQKIMHVPDQEIDSI